MVDAGLIFAYILIGLCALAAIGLPLVQAMGNPSSLKKIGISVGGLVVLFVVCYLIASDSTVGTTEEVTGGTAKRVGAGIIMFYLLLAGALVSIVYTEVKKLSK